MISLINPTLVIVLLQSLKGSKGAKEPVVMEMNVHVYRYWIWRVL